MLKMQFLGGLGGFQEKANCPLNLNLTHHLTLPLAAGKNKNFCQTTVLQLLTYLLDIL